MFTRHRYTLHKIYIIHKYYNVPNELYNTIIQTYSTKKSNILILLKRFITSYSRDAINPNHSIIILCLKNI